MLSHLLKRLRLKPKLIPVPTKSAVPKGYLRGKFEDWHFEHLEKQSCYSLDLKDCQKVVNYLCEEEGCAPPKVVSLSEVDYMDDLDSVAGLCFVDNRTGQPKIGLAWKWTPMFVLLHELAHYLEWVFNGHSVLRSLHKPNWDTSHSCWFQKELCYLVDEYEDLLASPTEIRGILGTDL